MAKRFISAILLAVLALSDAATFDNPLGDGETEVIQVNAKKVSQSLNDLESGTSRLGKRITIEYVPMNCRVQKYKGKKYFGTLATSGNWIESEDICVSICWQYKQQGFPCESVNYIETKKTCELMQDAYGQKSNGAVKDDSLTTYIIPQSCQQSGQPSQTTPAPVPTPAPTPGGSGGSGTIHPGSCGQASVKNRVSLSRAPFQRIVGGNEASPHSIPFIVSLRQRDWHYCGGTLVRVNEKDESDIVVTAAHCMSGESANFDVVAGAHYTNRQEAGEQKVSAAKVVIHPSYNKPQAYANDLAIVKLSRPIKFSQTIQPACLPGKSEGPADGKSGIVAGWGALREGGAAPEALNQVVVPVIGTQECQRMYSIVPEAMLCAGYDQGQQDSCQGDSGGPFFFEGKNGYTLQGVVSWGSGCARPRSPGVYTRVTSYVDWIQEKIRALSSV